MLCSHKLSIALAVAVSLSAATAFGQLGNRPQVKRPAEVTVKKEIVAPTKMDIVDTAMKAGSFKTLIAALKAADLDQTLKGKGPFTVFAPTDEAFDKLPSGTVESLLKPENKRASRGAADLPRFAQDGQGRRRDGMKSAKTVNGETVAIKSENDKLFINESQVVKADILCTNGVIHVVDAVLMPKD